MSEEFSKPFILYKAKRDGGGAASQWCVSSKKDSVFLEMADQKGKDSNNNPTFNWDKKIKFKLGVSDLGELLAVLRGIQSGVGPVDKDQNKHKGLFHQNDNGNSVLYFAKDDRNILRMCLSTKKGDERTRVQHAISTGEACVLETLLSRAVEIIHGWEK